MKTLLVLISLSLVSGNLALGNDGASDDLPKRCITDDDCQIHPKSLSELQKTVRDMRVHAQEGLVFYAYNTLMKNEEYTLKQIGTSEEELNALLKQGYGTEACNQLTHAQRAARGGDAQFAANFQSPYDQFSKLADNYLPTRCRISKSFWSDLAMTADKNSDVTKTCDLSEKITKGPTSPWEYAEATISFYKQSVALTDKKGGVTPENCRRTEKDFALFRKRNQEFKISDARHRIKEALTRINNAQSELRHGNLDLKAAQQEYNGLTKRFAEELINGENSRAITSTQEH